MNYLTDIPQSVENYGLCKTLLVRREIIHLKHILTEVFVRKTINIDNILQKIDWSLFEYMEYLTNRIRRVHNFTREYVHDVNHIVKTDRDQFFPTQELYKGLKNIIILDFDGVVTTSGFQKLYELCIDKNPTIICTANPSVTEEWFLRNELSSPHKIYANKGKIQKMKCLIEIQKHYDYVFYVDNEECYLEFAWLFGLQTYIWKNNKIVYFTLNSNK